MANVYDVDVYPRRVIRFVPQLPGSFVAQLNKETNVLLVDRDKFEQLSKWQRENVYVTKDDMVLEEARNYDMWA